MVGSTTGGGRQGTEPTTAQYRRGVKALVTGDDAVLLVKEHHAEGTPFWTLPGGGVRPDESLTDGLHRELREELDCHDVVVGDRTTRVWYAHRSRSGVASLYTVFECYTLSEPTPNGTEGIAASRWVRPDTLPPRTLPQVKSICRVAWSRF